MSVLRTEHDLRAALVELGADAPSVNDVLPSREDALHSEPKWARRGGRYLLPAVAAITTLVVAGVIAAVQDGRHDHTPAGHDTTQVVGVAAGQRLWPSSHRTTRPPDQTQRTFPAVPRRRLRIGVRRTRCLAHAAQDRPR